jgi:hypothetical protein
VQLAIDHTTSPLQQCFVQLLLATSRLSPLWCDNMCAKTAEHSLLPCAFFQEVGGTVFGYDPSTDIVMLKEPGTHGGVVNLRLYKAAQLQVCAESQKVCQQQQLGGLHVCNSSSRQGVYGNSSSWAGGVRVNSSSRGGGASTAAIRGCVCEQQQAGGVGA